MQIKPDFTTANSLTQSWKLPAALFNLPANPAFASMHSLAV